MNLPAIFIPLYCFVAASVAWNLRVWWKPGRWVGPLLLAVGGALCI